MSLPEPALYVGKVVHQRLQPIGHHLSYRVASLLVDVDNLKNLPSLLGYNHFNLFGLYDKDHGDEGSGETISEFAWRRMKAIDAQGAVKRILMLSYPRMLGYAFNPLSVYFGLDAQGQVRGVLYDVHNTFGQRHCYEAGPFAPGEAAFSETEKTFRVSPFNPVDGSYGLRVSVPGEQLSVGVSLRRNGAPILKAYFNGQRRQLTSWSLLAVAIGFPFMTLKVVAGIHWEALKLWLKGLKLQSP
jgi:uncharacterized protein